jgi:hypothetical protein
MKNIVSIRVFLTIVFVVVAIVVLYLFVPKTQTPNTGERIDAYSEPQKQLEHVQILETLDLNSGEPRFKLHVQTHVGTPILPDKLILFDKKTKQKVEEYVLTSSAYPNECISHHEMLDTMIKWDTPWFTLPALRNVDNSYASKLTDKYSVLVLYKDGSSQDIKQSSHMIDGVCYQVQKTVPEKPLRESEEED